MSAGLYNLNKKSAAIAARTVHRKVSVKKCSTLNLPAALLQSVRYLLTTSSLCSYRIFLVASQVCKVSKRNLQRFAVFFGSSYKCAVLSLLLLLQELLAKKDCARDDDDVVVAVPSATGGAPRPEDCSAQVLAYNATPPTSYRKPVLKTTLRPLNGICLCFHGHRCTVFFSYSPCWLLDCPLGVGLAQNPTPAPVWSH